jgi:hypothetical protein
MREGRLSSVVLTAIIPVCLTGLVAPMARSLAGDKMLVQAALYPSDKRRVMTGEDYRRYSGAGILYCRGRDGVFQKAAASWLIGISDLVMMNAHNFINRRAEAERSIDDCYYQIGGKNYDFVPGSLEVGAAVDANALHITDDWALARLRTPVDSQVAPQPVYNAALLEADGGLMPVTMVSPAGHANFVGASSIENCAIHAIDPPSEDSMRRARHDCNDGYGGSGSGLFDEAGHLVAMQSASLDMDRRLEFDIGLHYGSALLIEGKLFDAIMRDIVTQRQ